MGGVIFEALPQFVRAPTRMPQERECREWKIQFVRSGRGNS